MGMWKGRSLEEHQIKQQLPGIQPFRPEKIDVWMMGNVMFIVLTNLYTFEWPRVLSTSEAGNELIQGRRSPYPENVANSTDPSYVAIKKALDMCWVQDWRERPSARTVSEFLERLREITGEENPDLRVALPKRDKNQRPTDSDFTAKAY